MKKKFNDDSDYTETSDTEENNNKKQKIIHQTRRRSNSENDVYYLQIKSRSNYDNYFKNLDYNKKIDVLTKEKEIYDYYNSDTPLRYKILFSKLPISTKSLIIHKIDMYESMETNEPEYNKISKWLQGLSQIPFDTYINIPISISDSNDKITSFLQNSYDILKNTIYGQLEAKNKIMQILAQWISNPTSTGQIIALEGPPGVGKTSLIKHGVSRALNRPFCFYALGGATDVSNLEGHSYTYEGACWGRMVEMLMESKVMNPIIFFDELDKISDTSKGHEIVGLLTHLTDHTQNNTFQDKYFSGINLDFSKTLFFFSYNDVTLLNPILKDRLTIVKFNGYTLNEKINIIRDYILPDLLKNIGFNKNDIIINNNTIEHIIINYVTNEDGVRNIKRFIEDILLKINLLRLIHTNDNKLDIIYNIDNLIFPFEITVKIIKELSKK